MTKFQRLVLEALMVLLAYNDLYTSSAYQDIHKELYKD